MADQDDDNQPLEGGDQGAGDGGPPPLGEGGAEASSAADSMEQNLPDALKGSSASVALGQGSMSEKDEKTYGMLAHILGIFPLIGPLVIWMIKRDDSPFVNDQGREAVSFQLIVVIAFVAVAILNAIPGIGCFAVFIYPVVGLINVIMVIMAGMKAGDGVAYRYPFALRVL